MSNSSHRIIKRLVTIFIIYLLVGCSTKKVTTMVRYDPQIDENSSSARLVSIPWKVNPDKSENAHQARVVELTKKNHKLFVQLSYHSNGHLRLVVPPGEAIFVDEPLITIRKTRHDTIATYFIFWDKTLLDVIQKGTNVNRSSDSASTTPLTIDLYTHPIKVDFSDTFDLMLPVFRIGEDEFVEFQPITFAIERSTETRIDRLYWLEGIINAI